jgi:hypothetical protein
MPEADMTTTSGVGVTVIRGGQPVTETGGWATFDVELEKLGNEAKQWITALSGTVDMLVREAEKPQRDSAILTMQTAAGTVNDALRTLVDAVYERKVVQ